MPIPHFEYRFHSELAKAHTSLVVVFFDKTTFHAISPFSACPCPVNLIYMIIINLYKDIISLRQLFTLIDIAELGEFNLHIDLLWEPTLSSLHSCQCICWSAPTVHIHFSLFTYAPLYWSNFALTPNSYK